VGEAVAAAVDGGTTFIAPGTYIENLDIDDDVTLIGREGAAVTTIDGGANGTVVTLTGFSLVQLRGLTIRSGPGHGAGGIDARGVIDIVDSVIEDKHGSGALGGGGIAATGFLTLDRPQVLNNTTSNFTLRVRATLL